MAYGVNLELDKCDVVSNHEKDSVNFVARTSKNNGVVARVKPIEGIKPQQPGTISCAAGGSVLSSFVQAEPYYSGRDLLILTPKTEMTLQEKLYWCVCIKKNAYRYSYGRQANKTLEDLDIPNAIPNWVSRISIDPIQTSNKETPHDALSLKRWGDFRIGDLFHVCRGYRLVKTEMFDGNTNYIGAIDDNNGVRQRIDALPLYRGNAITVNYNGSVGEAFYQAEPYWPSDDVKTLTPREGWELTPAIALFLTTIIKANRYRFSYGRKWTSAKMTETVIRLPVDKNGIPDWEFMERYISELPYYDQVRLRLRPRAPKS